MKIGVYLLLHPCNSTMAARVYIPAPDLLPTDNPCAEEKEEAQAIAQGGIRAARWFFLIAKVIADGKRGEQTVRT